MDFTLSGEQEEIRNAAAGFAKGEFDKEIALEHERAHSFPTAIRKKAAELGSVGIHSPAK